MWNDDTKDELIELLDACEALDVAPSLTLAVSLMERGVILEDIDEEGTSA